MKIQKTHIILPIVVGALTPSLAIILLQVFLGSVPPMRSVDGVLERQFAEGDNMFLVMVFGMIPFIVLIGITWLQAREADIVSLNYRFYGGLLGIVSYMLYKHISIWLPMYTDEKLHSTFGLGFILVPFYCIVTMVIGMVAGWLVYRLRRQ